MTWIMLFESVKLFFIRIILSSRSSWTILHFCDWESLSIRWITVKICTISLSQINRKANFEFQLLMLFHYHQRVMLAEALRDCGELWRVMESLVIVSRCGVTWFWLQLIHFLAGKTSSSVNWARYEILSMKECKNFFTVNNYTEYIERNFCGRGIAASTCQVFNKQYFLHLEFLKIIAI